MESDYDVLKLHPSASLVPAPLLHRSPPRESRCTHLSHNEKPSFAERAARTSPILRTGGCPPRVPLAPPHPPPGQRRRPRVVPVRLPPTSISPLRFIPFWLAQFQKRTVTPPPLTLRSASRRIKQAFLRITGDEATLQTGQISHVTKESDPSGWHRAGAFAAPSHGAGPGRLLNGAEGADLEAMLDFGEAVGKHLDVISAYPAHKASAPA